MFRSEAKTMYTSQLSLNLNENYYNVVHAMSTLQILPSWRELRQRLANFYPLLHIFICVVVYILSTRIIQLLTLVNSILAQRIQFPVYFRWWLIKTSVSLNREQQRHAWHALFTLCSFIHTHTVCVERFFTYAWEQVITEHRHSTLNI